MELKSDILCGLFLNEVHSLRQQKGKYLQVDFCAHLERMSCHINKTIHESFGFTPTVSQSNLYQQNPEKISNDLIDLCLECIEIDFQRLQTSHKLPLQNSSVPQTLQILLSISDDLQALASHIKFTINSDKSDKPIAIEKTNDGKQILFHIVIHQRRNKYAYIIAQTR